MKKKICVLIGPSGSGKSTIAEEIKKNYGAKEFISTTTRSPRKDEIKDVSYFFKSREEFEEMKKNGELVESSEYAGNYYGLTKESIYDTLEKTDLIIAVLDKYGAFAIKHLFENNENVEVVFIFINAKISTLYLRMVNRGDKVEKIAERLQNIIDNKEMMQGAFCDYSIFNDGDFEITKQSLRHVVEKILEKN